jgi:hypothetical protein
MATKASNENLMWWTIGGRSQQAIRRRAKAAINDFVE